ncbi:MAG TPA: undecaprenyl-diphosphatase UppP [Gaiellaceae bacterium]|nr:undecaprenyl-diphosphatase UppP [Gaiellaceae bacterium]
MSSRLVYLGAAVVFLVALILAAFRVGERAGRLSDWQALVLGIVQGATELLPISSSGHLILVPWAADWTYLEQHDSFNKTFDVALHLGTLVAVVLYFWNDIVRYVVAWVGSVRRRQVSSPDERIAWAVAAATIPAAIAGGVGENAIDKHLGDPWQIAIVLAVFGVLLWVADRLPEQRRLEDVGVRNGFLVGLAQVLALIPGVSRSGITITAGRFWRLERDAAARLSFLLLVPVVLGAVVFKGIKDVILNPLPAGSAGPFVVGTLAAVAVGLVAIDLLLGYVRRHDYSPFVLYRVAVAAAVLIVIAAGVRDSTF